MTTSLTAAIKAACEAGLLETDKPYYDRLIEELKSEGIVRPYHVADIAISLLADSISFKEELCK